MLTFTVSNYAYAMFSASKRANVRKRRCSMAETDSELVSIPVPKRHLTRVYGFIASLEGTDGISQAALGLNGDGSTKEWTPELIRRQFLESPDTIKRFEKLLAEHEGKWLSTSDIA